MPAGGDEPPGASVLGLSSPGGAQPRPTQPQSTQPQSTPPDCFPDLNLDQVVAALVSGREQYRLEEFFWSPLPDRDAVAFRQDVFGDLEQPPVVEAVRSFVSSMETMRDCLVKADKVHYERPAQRWFLEAVATYCEAVAELRDTLEVVELKSEGLLGVTRVLARYVESEGFSALREEASGLARSIGSIVYTLRLSGSRITVRRYEESPDYSVVVASVFEKFRQAASTPRRASPRDQMPELMNHVEVAIADMVARLYPDTFAALERFCAGHREYLDREVAAFDREVQFYLAYLDFMAGLRESGLGFCYPEMSAGPEDTYATDAFDVALATRLRAAAGTGPAGGAGTGPGAAAVVCNDFSFGGPERILVVSGPNQGGKTTFARTVGQVHYLASLGCPVPASAARLLMVDRVFTHFEREETLDNVGGKLEDDLLRVQAILRAATSSSLVVVNEIFTSTTADDALYLSREVLDKVIEMGALGVMVSFIDELATLGPATVSMVSSVDPSRPVDRTYKVLRQPPDGLAYATAIADKYGLSYQALRERIGRS